MIFNKKKKNRERGEISAIGRKPLSIPSLDFMTDSASVHYTEEPQRKKCCNSRRKNRLSSEIFSTQSFGELVIPPSASSLLLRTNAGAEESLWEEAGPEPGHRGCQPVPKPPFPLLCCESEL